MFCLHISTSNAAFEDDPSPELARLLREAANQLEREASPSGCGIFDTNGNHVGHWEFTD